MPTQMHFIPNCRQSGQRWQGSRSVDRCLTRVEPTIKVWSDVHGGSGLNSWFDLNCVGATKITAKPRSRSNLNLVQAWSTLVKRALKVKGQGRWEWNCKNRYSCMSSSNVDRFMSNQDQNDQRFILHISSNTFHQQKCFVLWYLSSVIWMHHMSQWPPIT